jgi:glycosyltransferase involved in cell wall biosynthesis
VLQFVSQPSYLFQAAIEPPTREKMEVRYGFKGHFFFLPNQFWRHKNHAIVFTAVKTLKERGIEVLLLCTGNLRDYRMKDTSYIDGLYKYISDNNLGQNIKILGAIDYIDVLFLMRNSVAMINPSRFEGWSSTVEEAKSMAKKLILSNIPVHREQNPSGALFFDPDDEQGLSQAMAAYWASPIDVVSKEDEKQAAEDLYRRTLAYAEGYSRVVLALDDENSKGGRFDKHSLASPSCRQFKGGWEQRKYSSPPTNYPQINATLAVDL